MTSSYERQLADLHARVMAIEAKVSTLENTLHLHWGHIRDLEAEVERLSHNLDVATQERNALVAERLAGQDGNKSEERT